MFKSLSKSTTIMFLFDFIVLSLSTFIWASIFEYTPKAIVILCITTVLTGLAVLFLKGHYKIREFNVNMKNAYLLFEGVVMTHVIPAAYLLIFASSITSTINFIAVNIITIFIILRLYRVFYHFYLFRIKREKNILILGSDHRAKVIADEIQGKKALRMRVAGFVQVNETNEEFAQDDNVLIYKDVNDLSQIIKENEIDIVVIAQATELIITAPRSVAIYKMPDFYEMVTGKYYIDEKTITELYYQFATQRSYAYDFCKRVYDIIAASIILIVTLPVTAYIAIRVKLTDGASPFFSQTRVGKNGKTFQCYKLRTMYVNDYVPKNAQMLNDGADRTIPFCKWIRKAKLDEIPQMVNILKGEMSIVGPRAEWEKFVNIYTKDLPFYECRMWVKTGWTGWAHICMQAAYSLDEERERLEYDLYYIKHRNVLWEIAILIKAVFLAVGGRHK
ncbi:sugar transferase [bacterium]|nr:sugar transferase [bacterium]